MSYREEIREEIDQLENLARGTLEALREARRELDREDEADPKDVVGWLHDASCDGERIGRRADDAADRVWDENREVLE